MGLKLVTMLVATAVLVAPSVVGMAVAGNKESIADFTIELYPEGTKEGPEVIYVPVRRPAPPASEEAAGRPGGEEPSEPSKARRFLLQQGIPSNR